MKKWVIVSIAPAVFLVIGGGIVEFIIRSLDTSHYISAQNIILEIEHEKILDTVDVSEDKRMEMLCGFYNSRMFRHSDTLEILSSHTSKDIKCTKNGYDNLLDISRFSNDTLNNSDILMIKTCIEDSKAVTGSCTAYDKSGIYGTPRARCTLEIEAGDNRFFAQETVTVLSEKYRKRRGLPAQEAVKGKPMESNENGVNLFTQFTGAIGCTNAKGTGRTCRSYATIQAISYPLRCSQWTSQLKVITRDKG